MRSFVEFFTVSIPNFFRYLCRCCFAREAIQPAPLANPVAPVERPAVPVERQALQEQRRQVHQELGQLRQSFAQSDPLPYQRPRWEQRINRHQLLADSMDSLALAEQCNQVDLVNRLNERIQRINQEIQEERQQPRLLPPGN